MHIHDSPSDLFADIPAELPQELFQTVAGSGNVRIERILSRGHCSAPQDWYDQKTHEWVLVLQGRGRIEFGDGSEVELGPGQHLDIPAGCRHRVSWTDPTQTTLWLAVHYG